MRDDPRLSNSEENRDQNRKEEMFTSFIALLLKLISNPALLAALIAYLQKTLHP